MGCVVTDQLQRGVIIAGDNLYLRIFLNRVLKVAQLAIDNHGHGLFRQ